MRIVDCHVHVGKLDNAAALLAALIPDQWHAYEPRLEPFWERIMIGYHGLP